jgi:hypothetical protein
VQVVVVAVLSLMLALTRAEVRKARSELAATEVLVRLIEDELTAYHGIVEQLPRVFRAELYEHERRMREIVRTR